MQMTNSELNNYILYSNKNLEKVCRSIINESSNAVLLEMYEDKMILADHISGGIYMADYNYDVKNATLQLENFENIDVVPDSPKLKDAINAYFEDDGYDVAAIIEAYEDDQELGGNELSESITSALAAKNGKDLLDYNQIIGINEEVEELKNMKFFKEYSNYLLESPTSSVKVIDWVNPVRVSLVSKDANKVLTFSAKEKAASLSKNPEFKMALKEAARDMFEGYSESMIDLLSENYSILSLDPISLREAVTMAIASDKTLMENRNEVIKELNEVIDEDEILSNYREVLSEDAEEANDPDDKKLETSDKDMDALINALNKVLDKDIDEKLMNKIEDLKSALEASKSEGTTDVETVKECVEILSL